MNRIRFNHVYEDIISIENLLIAWKEFSFNKRKKKDVQNFSLQLMENIIHLHDELTSKSYTHGVYQAFNINDPKPRNIHKALVRDRLLHHAVYRKLYPFFDVIFISDSFSCRLGKGIHKAIQRFIRFAGIVSKNNRKTCWILKCDVRKFFASIDHVILIGLLERFVSDSNVLRLVDIIISSFHSHRSGTGLPLGNLTSQLLVNIYMNEFDQFIKHKLKSKYYIRYADDFVIFSDKKEYLESLVCEISVFLQAKLGLSLHPEKLNIKTLASGVDFLGWVHFPNHRVLRTSTKRKMFRKLEASLNKLETVRSYIALLKHGNSKKLRQKITA